MTLGDAGDGLVAPEEAECSEVLEEALGCVEYAMFSVVHPLEKWNRRQALKEEVLGDCVEVVKYRLERWNFLRSLWKYSRRG